MGGNLGGMLLPVTVLTANAEEESAIRLAVRLADPSELGPGRVYARPEHGQALSDLLGDPGVSAPLYDLPRPITPESMRQWIDASADARARGEGLLILNFDPTGMLGGYSEITVWPERASAELGGALRPSAQGGGHGAAGAFALFDWMFRALKVRLIALTAAEDNVRSIKLIDKAGFRRMGLREVAGPDGPLRVVYWEVTREAWETMWG
jgi:RimJ/RimL family protein N-acetyltransferase